jgi:integrase
MPTRKSLSERVISTLPIPEKGRTYTYDETVRHLALCITSNGTKTWYRCAKVRGRAERARIGAYPEITVKRAREIAADMGSQLAAGKAPIVGRLGRMTLGELWAWYLANHAKPRKRTWERDVARWDSHLSKWQNKPLSSITQAKVVELHNTLKDAVVEVRSKTGQTIRRNVGTYGANHVLALLRHMLSLAVTHGWIEGNVAKGVAEFPRHDRERFLDGDELPRFFAALETLQRQTPKDFFAMCLWTGARRGNVASMRWDEVSIESAVWAVPGDKAKGKKPLKIVLPPPAVEILRRRLSERRAVLPWVFPGHGKSGHYSWPKDAWNRVVAAAGLRDVRIHDLRRTLGSWQAAGGSSLHIIGKSLGHTNSRTTEIYARMNLDPVRKSVEGAVAAIQAVSQKPQKKI